MPTSHAQHCHHYHQHHASSHHTLSGSIPEGYHRPSHARVHLTGDACTQFFGLLASPAAVGRHQASSSDSNLRRDSAEFLFVYGGGAADGSCRAAADAKWRVLDLDTFKWKTLMSSNGPAPGPRYGHTVSAYHLDGRPYLCIFAGVDLTGRYQSELSIFDILANRWLDLSAPSLAHLHSRQARFLHAASVLELAEHRDSPKLYITGGYAEQTHFTHVLGTLEILDLRTLTWSASSRIPQRHSHSSCFMPSSPLLDGRPALLLSAGYDELAQPASSEMIAIDPRVALRSQDKIGSPTASFSQGIADMQPCWVKVQNSFGHLPLSQIGSSSALVVDHSIVLLSQIQPDSTCSHVPPTSAQTLAPLPTRTQVHLFDCELAVWTCLADPEAEAEADSVETSLQSGHSHHLFGHNDSLLIPAPMWIQQSERDEHCLVTIGGSSPGRLDSLRVINSWLLSAGSVLPEGTTLPTDFASLLAPPCWQAGTVSAATFADGPPRVSLPDFNVHSEDAHRPAIAVHQLVLYTRWPHFHQLLSTGMRESAHLETYIDESYEAVYALIHFIYSDRLPDYISQLQVGPLAGVYQQPFLVSEDDDGQTAVPLFEHKSDGPSEPGWATCLKLLRLASMYLLPQLFEQVADLLLSRLLTMDNLPLVYQTATVVSRASPDGKGLRRKSMSTIESARPLSWPGPANSRDSRLLRTQEPDSVFSMDEEASKSVLEHEQPQSMAEAFLQDILDWCAERYDQALDRFEAAERDRIRYELRSQSLTLPSDGTDHEREMEMVMEDEDHIEDGVFESFVADMAKICETIIPPTPSPLTGIVSPMRLAPATIAAAEPTWMTGSPRVELGKLVSPPPSGYGTPRMLFGTTGLESLELRRHSLRQRLQPSPSLSVGASSLLDQVSRRLAKSTSSSDLSNASVQGSATPITITERLRAIALAKRRALRAQKQSWGLHASPGGVGLMSPLVRRSFDAKERLTPVLESRVRPTLSDVASGRATPSNASATVRWHVDTARRHHPLLTQSRPLATT